MPPIMPTRSHSAHYSPYNLPSRGSPQKPKLFSTPLSLSRPLEHCRASASCTPLPGNRVTLKGVQPFTVSGANNVPFEVMAQYY